LVSTWSILIIAKSLYNAALIGCGRIGSLLEADPLREKPCTHAGAYHQHKRIALIAGCDINPERLFLFKKQWSVDNSYHDYHDLLANTDIDILSVATEIKNHHEIVMEASEHDIPLIICEKPIGLSLDKAQQMIKACKTNKSRLLINHERRFSSNYLQAKKMIHKGDIGEVLSIRGNILTGVPKKGTHYAKEGGGSLLHDGTHLIDIIRFLTDSDVKWVTAEMQTTKDIQVETSIVGLFQLSNGVNCFIEAGGKRNYFTFEVDIYGTEGRIIIGNGIFRWFKAEKSQYYTGFNDLVEQEIPSFPYTPQFLNVMDRVVQYLDHDISPTSIGDDGYKALETIFAFYQSAIDQQRITLPLAISDKNPLKKLFTDY